MRSLNHSTINISVVVAVLFAWLFSHTASAQLIPYFTILNEPGENLEGYTVTIKQMYGEDTSFSDVERWLVQTGESDGLIAITDIFWPSGELFATDVIAAPVNGTQFVSVGSSLCLKRRIWITEAEGWGKLSTYHFEIDSDRDGVADGDDDCDNSDRRATIFLGDTDTGVSNDLLADGCSLSDLIQKALSESNTGIEVKDVVGVLIEMKRDGYLTGAEVGTILKSLSQ